jgi:hypothetical protein
MEDSIERSINLEKAPFQIEEKDNGDLFFISHPDINILITLGAEITLELNRSPFPTVKQFESSLKNGESIRPQAVFGVIITGKKLMIDNKNGRGDVKYREELKNAIDKVLALHK